LVPSPDGAVQIEFRSNSVAFPAQVYLGVVELSEAPSGASDGDNVPTYAFDISIAAQGTGLVDTSKFSTPVVLYVEYSQENLAAADGDPTRLSLARFDADTEDWVIVPTQVDTKGRVLRVETIDPGIWGVFVTAAPATSQLTDVSAGPALLGAAPAAATVVAVPPAAPAAPLATVASATVVTPPPAAPAPGAPAPVEEPSGTPWWTWLILGLGVMSITAGGGAWAYVLAHRRGARQVE